MGTSANIFLVLLLFNFGLESKIKAVDWLILVQCCISWRSQSFEFAANQTADFYMKYNMELKYVSWIILMAGVDYSDSYCHETLKHENSINFLV